MHKQRFQRQCVPLSFAQPRADSDITVLRCDTVSRSLSDPMLQIVLARAAPRTIMREGQWERERKT